MFIDFNRHRWMKGWGWMKRGKGTEGKRKQGKGLMNFVLSPSKFVKVTEEPYKSHQHNVNSQIFIAPTFCVTTEVRKVWYF